MDVCAAGSPLKQASQTVRALDQYKGRIYRLLNQRGEDTVLWFRVKDIRGRWCPFKKQYDKGWVSLETASGPDKIGLPSFLAAVNDSSIREVPYAPGSVTH